MDNLTHSLIGAVLGQAGLKRRTGLAMPALILGANLPDIDAACTLYGVESLAMRRGITHGPIGLAILPAILAGILIAMDRLQARRGTRPMARPEVRPGWLLALCYLGAVTHPVFDWLNSFGIRLLTPFSRHWFYGDALFIIDPWLLAILGAGLWFSRKRERNGAARWRRPALAAMAASAIYVVFNLWLSVFAVDQMREKLKPASNRDVLVVANPVPIAFWRREMLLRQGPFYGSADFSLGNDLSAPTRGIVGAWRDERRSMLFDLNLTKIEKENAQARAFLFWSRMPIAEKQGGTVVLADQRFLQGPARGNFSVQVNPK